jgi:phenylpyruvate tautomerase PptA (4-oxalocrotonate tautomerase family)
VHVSCRYFYQYSCPVGCSRSEVTKLEIVSRTQLGAFLAAVACGERQSLDASELTVVEGGSMLEVSNGGPAMPMIDVYAADGTFDEKRKLAQDLAAAVMRWEQVPDLPLFRNNTAAFVHELPASAIANVNGDSDYVRVQVLTPAGVLDRDKQLGVVKELTEIVASAAGDPSLAERTWVLLTESPEGGWGVAGHANTGADLAQAARAELAAKAVG